jgi:Family of unknown function (DUF6492)
MQIMPEIPMQISELISVCCLKDIEAWEITSGFMVRNIAAKEYRVIVPDGEIDEFVKKSPPQFKVVGESRYTKQFRDQLLKLLPQDKKSQFGWYLQQFIKLLAIKDNQENAIVLIWDADTAPINKLEFINPEGKLVYYKSTENHTPYFETIERLTGLKKIVSFSFIAQCFPVKVAWLNELCRELEEKFRMPWVEAVLSQIDFATPNSFSEYETLGTFISHGYADQVVYSDRPWWRLGNTLLNHVAFLSLKKAEELSKQYDFISFEKWERAKPYFIKVSIPYFFRIYLPSLFKKTSNRHV